MTWAACRWRNGAQLVKTLYELYCNEEGRASAITEKRVLEAKVAVPFADGWDAFVERLSTRPPEVPVAHKKGALETHLTDRNKFLPAFGRRRTARGGCAARIWIAARLSFRRFSSVFWWSIRSLVSSDCMISGENKAGAAGSVTSEGGGLSAAANVATPCIGYGGQAESRLFVPGPEKCGLRRRDQESRWLYWTKNGPPRTHLGRMGAGSRCQ